MARVQGQVEGGVGSGGGVRGDVQEVSPLPEVLQPSCHQDQPPLFLLLPSTTIKTNHCYGHQLPPRATPSFCHCHQLPLTTMLLPLPRSVRPTLPVVVRWVP